MPAQHLGPKTSWDNFEVIVIENNSTDPATFAYYQEARQRYDGLQVVTYPQKGFNFSGINNFGRKYASGRLPAAAEQRRGGAQRRLAHGAAAAVRPPRRRGHLRCRAALPGRDAAACGRRDGLGGYAGHSHKYSKAGGSGYMFRAATVQDSFRRDRCLPAGETSVWDESGRPGRGLCGGLQRCGLLPAGAGCRYRIAWTPYAQLTHYESKSRGGDEKDPVKARRFAAEQQRLYAVHGQGQHSG